MKRDLLKFLYVATIMTGLAVSSTPAQTVPFGSSLKGKSKLQPSGNRAISPPAPEMSPRNEDDYERVETRIVVSDVEVFDKKGSRVVGLTANDFEIREEGELQEPQSVTFAEHAANGRWIILVLDYSMSILPYMETSLSGAETLVNGMRPNGHTCLTLLVSTGSPMSMFSSFPYPLPRRSVSFDTIPRD